MAKYKVGDKVRVRQWDDMAKEYGVNYSGDILSHGMFTSEMRKYCGKNVNISHIGKRGYYMIKEDNGNWDWSDDMFETIFKSESEYTGIELLQAINDKKVKHGDKFTMTYGNKNIPHHSDVYITKLGNIRIGTVENLNENLSVDIILSSTFTPIKAKPINHAEKEREYNTVASIKILDGTIYVPVRVIIKGYIVTGKQIGRAHV